LPAFPAGLFHHFESKQDLGYAIVDEIIRGHILEHWVKPLERSTDPVADIQKALRHRGMRLPADDAASGLPPEQSRAGDVVRRRGVPRPRRAYLR
jgi:AcrR family transcriptional regulator